MQLYVAFQAAAKKEGFGLNFELISHQTLQQNGRVKHKFAILFGRVQSMLNLAGLMGKCKNLRHGLWAECTNMATKMENVMGKPDKEPPFRQFFKKDSLFLNSLHVFGEIGVANNVQKLHSKLANQGMHCMFIGYANYHAGNTFKMFNLKTKHIWKSCNVKWIAASLTHLELCEEQICKPKMDNKDNEVQYVRSMGVNLIPYDEDEVIANLNDDKDMEDAEAAEAAADTTSVAHPTPNKTI